MNIHIEPESLDRLRDLAAQRRQALDTAQDLDQQGLHNQASSHHDQAADLDSELATAVIDLLDLEGDQPADELAHLAELVDGQGPVDWCGCGEPMTEYDGVLLHVYNPALTGADDHDASP